MSQANVEALRNLYDEWGRGDFRGGRDLFAPDIVVEPFVERSTVHGLAAFGDYFREFLEQWDDFRIEGREFTVAGDSVVVEERQTAAGKTSGIEMVKTFYAVWTFEGGSVVRVRWEDDCDTALEIAGLNEGI